MHGGGKVGLHARRRHRRVAAESEDGPGVFQRAESVTRLLALGQQLANHGGVARQVHGLHAGGDAPEARQVFGAQVLGVLDAQPNAMRVGFGPQLLVDVQDLGVRPVPDGVRDRRQAQAQRLAAPFQDEVGRVEGDAGARAVGKPRRVQPGGAAAEGAVGKELDPAPLKEAARHPAQAQRAGRAEAFVRQAGPDPQRQLALRRQRLQGERRGGVLEGHGMGADIPPRGEVLRPGAGVRQPLAFAGGRHPLRHQRLRVFLQAAERVNDVAAFWVGRLVVNPGGGQRAAVDPDHVVVARVQQHRVVGAHGVEVGGGGVAAQAEFGQQKAAAHNPLACRGLRCPLA